MTSANRVAVERVNPLASLRMIRAYKTVSGEAASFLAGSPLMDLVTRERAQRWELRKEGLQDEEKEARWHGIRTRTIAQWQERWSADSGKASWTKALFPNVERWLGSGGSARLTFHLTQALTGHGCFNKYLFKIGKAASPSCWWCPDTIDDPGHTIVSCDHYAEERRDMARSLGRSMEPADVERVLCGENGLRWINNTALRDNPREDEVSRRTEFSRMLTAIISAKEAEERSRQAAARLNRGEQGHNPGPGEQQRRRTRHVERIPSRSPAGGAGGFVLPPSR